MKSINIKPEKKSPFFGFLRPSRSKPGERKKNQDLMSFKSPLKSSFHESRSKEQEKKKVVLNRNFLSMEIKEGPLNQGTVCSFLENAADLVILQVRAPD